MQDVFKNYLFSKQILVNDTNICREEAFSVMLSMAKLFNIRLTNGRELATVEHIRFVSKKLGEKEYELDSNIFTLYNILKKMS